MSDQSDAPLAQVAANPGPRQIKAAIVPPKHLAERLNQVFTQPDEPLEAIDVMLGRLARDDCAS